MKVNITMICVCVKRHDLQDCKAAVLSVQPAVRFVVLFACYLTPAVSAELAQVAPVGLIVGPAQNKDELERLHAVTGVQYKTRLDTPKAYHKHHESKTSTFHIGIPDVILRNRHNIR